MESSVESLNADREERWMRTLVQNAAISKQGFSQRLLIPSWLLMFGESCLAGSSTVLLVRVEYRLRDAFGK
jgi:hypothetical protein